MVDPERLSTAAPYHYAAIATGGLVFTAGACPLDEHGRVIPGGARAQARRAVENLFEVLAAAGTDAGHLLKTTVYAVAADRGELVDVWAEVEAALAPARPPSTLLGVSLLGYPDQLVEIEAVAEVPLP